MLFALLTFGSLWFWAGLLIPAILLVIFVDRKSASGAFFTVLLVIVLWVAFGDKRLVPWVIHHPLRDAEYVGGYFLVGIIWGFVKWFLYVLGIRDDYETYRAEWVEKYGPIDESLFPPSSYNNQARTSQPMTKRQMFVSNVGSHLQPPKAARHKGEIIFWMSYWPFSAVWTIIHDPITRLYRFIYHRIAVVFDGISRSMFKKYEGDFEQ